MLELSFYHYTVNNFCKIIPKHKSSRVYWKSNDLKLISLHDSTAQCYKMEKRYEFVCLFDLILYVPSTIFQL